MLTAYLIFSICVNVTLLVFVLFYARKNARQAGEMAELRQTLYNAAASKARNEKSRIIDAAFSLPVRNIVVEDRVNFNIYNIRTALELYAGKYVDLIIRKYRSIACQELDFKIFNRLYELYMENKNDTSPLIRISVPVVAPIIEKMSVEKTTGRS